MKKVGEIMREMGFNPESSEETQKAFIKYLLRVANKGKHVPEPFLDVKNQDADEWQELKIHSRGHAKPTSNKDSTNKQPAADKQEQLCFDFEQTKSDSEAC